MHDFCNVTILSSILSSSISISLPDLYQGSPTTPSLFLSNLNILTWTNLIQLQSTHLDINNPYK